MDRVTASALVDIGKLVTCTPGVYGGRPCLAGTRFPVLQVALLHNEGWTPERIAAEYDLPDIAAVYAGVAFYLANKAAIDGDLEEERLAYEEGARRQRIEMDIR